MMIPMDCQMCPELCASRTQIVYPDLPEFGRQYKVLVVGEAPGADEDAQGKGFVGRAGRTLHALMEEFGLRRGYDYGCANIVRCRPPENRRPTETEIANCLPYLADVITKAQPRVVLTVGETATRAITGIRGLTDNIRLLSENRQDPRAAKSLCAQILQTWPDGALLVPMPHTSPLAWNRNAPDGRKWADIGREQVRLVRALSRAGRP
jgi:uracil-DNA glycosylase family 4